MSELLSITEVSELLKVSDRTIRNWIQDGTIKAYRFGNVYRIRKEDFDEFVNKSQVNYEEEKGDN